LFAQYSILHTRAEDLALASVSWDARDYARAAHMLSGMGADEEDVSKYVAFLGLGIAAIDGARGDTCPQCGTVRPDLARSSGKMRIDPDGLSLWCADCVAEGRSLANPDPKQRYWVRTWADYEVEALATDLSGPEWTGPGDHFAAFKGGPGLGEENSPLWGRLNQFIRNYMDKIRYGGGRERK
jgi:hypothetical protein